MPAWLPTRNHLNRLAQPPKHHLADPALAVRLLGLDADALLSGAEIPGRFPRDGALLGRLFESLVTLCVRVYAQAAEARVRHLRLHGGRRKIDLIVKRADQGVVAIEVKLGATVDDDDVRNLHWLREQIGNDLLEAVVIHSGPRSRSGHRRGNVSIRPPAWSAPLVGDEPSPTARPEGLEPPTF